MRPEQARILAERNIMPARGPRFYRDGDAVMFEFIIDTTNILGPFPANRKHQEEHAGAWAAFVAAEGISPLDRDASGEVGGSLPEQSVVGGDGGSPQESAAAPVVPEPKRRGRPPKVRSE